MIKTPGCNANYPSDGTANQAVIWEDLATMIRFIKANTILIFGIYLCNPRYRVFRYRGCPLTTANTCLSLALTDDFSCPLRFICPADVLEFLPV